MGLHVRPGDMLQCGQFLRGEDSGTQSVVGHDTGAQKGLQIAGNMYVDAQIRYLVWSGQVKILKSGLVKRRKVTETGAEWRLVVAGMAARV